MNLNPMLSGIETPDTYLSFGAKSCAERLDQVISASAMNGSPNLHHLIYHSEFQRRFRLT